ncbi:AIR carboxylase family protein [Patescibacteria group bacterium]|nr:AIR carboxylase family protein [Patescibacteria group bacterium]MBU1702810.1 AIR carboxylase family protein [Patescibacteria group bacterium]MBU1953797.1 AIR carboxylase family protein [Patescibacteria group bacterium]
MKMIVPILLGSESDRPWAAKITDELDKWDIPYKIHVVSAHKVPELLVEIVREYNGFDGLLCYVTIAGRSNGLSGCTAGSSVHPVIACPPFKDKEDMMINLNSTVQMPSETPVLTVLDPNNVVNGIVRIFALGNSDLKKRYENHIKKIKASFYK